MRFSDRFSLSLSCFHLVSSNDTWNYLHKQNVFFLLNSFLFLFFSVFNLQEWTNCSVCVVDKVVSNSEFTAILLRFCLYEIQSAGKCSSAAQQTDNITLHRTPDTFHMRTKWRENNASTYCHTALHCLWLLNDFDCFMNTYFHLQRNVKWKMVRRWCTNHRRAALFIKLEVPTIIRMLSTSLLEFYLYSGGLW